MLLIKNAIIVNADKLHKETNDILLNKGVIEKIAPTIKAADAKTIDAKGKLVFPGLIDLHVHFREPGREDKETIETGSKAAAKGGFTTVMCMPNTTPVIDNAVVVEAILKESRRVGLVNVIPMGAITKGQKGDELVDMFELKKAGCLALSDDGKTVASSQIMRMAFEYAKMTGMVLVEHCQDPLLWAGGVMNEGFNSTVLGLKGDPGISETVIVARDIELGYYLKGRIHLAHMSLKRSVDLIRFAKECGIQVTAEACPHHFTLTDDAVKGYDTNTKMNPPLRTQEDVDAIKEGLKDGTIDCIVTDHAPHTHEEKELEYAHAPYGIVGLETSVGLTMTQLVHKKVLTLPQMADRMSAAPARIMGLEGKGVIKEGADADITIIDPDVEWTVQKTGLVSKSKNTPFLNWRLKGAAVTTILGGKITFEAN